MQIYIYWAIFSAMYHNFLGKGLCETDGLFQVRRIRRNGSVSLLRMGELITFVQYGIPITCSFCANYQFEIIPIMPET